MSARSHLMALIGEGVRPSLTPPMHEAEGAAQGIPLVYRPIDLTEVGRDAESVGDLVREGVQWGFDAFNVTHPCKRMILDHLDEVDPVAARLGSVNTVLVRDGALIGHNTDRSGFASGLRHCLPSADLTHVVQLGAGGAGAAVADALVGLGAERITIVDPDLGRARAVAAQVRTGRPVDTAVPDDAPDAVAGASGLVNTSPIGMFTHPGTPIPVAALHPGLWVADIVYRPVRTALLDAARACGCAVMEGGHMAVGQAADTFDLVTGRRADRARMRAHFDALVAEEAGRGPAASV